MKIRRYKKVHRHMGFYVNNFGFRSPYQLLVDGTFCLIALNNKINITDNIPRYLQSELKVLTTQCAIIETENLGPKLNGALVILKQFGIHRCGHEGKPISAAECFSSMVGEKNEHHYIIATQDRDLQEEFRNIPGVPLLYLHSKTPVLDSPSEASIKYSQNRQTVLLESERKAIEELKTKSGVVEEERKFKKKKRKGANPLSCLKKKKHQDQNKIAKKIEKNIERSKRKRLRIPKHVKEELLQKIKVSV